jgi:F0F1-type ATP synthase membrane subunit b/b'
MFKKFTLLGESLKSRKETILRSLNEAESKFKEAEENLSFAKENFEAAKIKSEQIKQQGLILSEKTFKTLIEAVEEDIKRLKALNLATVKMEEEKSINEICKKLTQVALIKAIEKISSKLNANLQKKIISRKIEKFSIKALN